MADLHHLALLHIQHAEVDFLRQVNAIQAVEFAVFVFQRPEQALVDSSKDLETLFDHGHGRGRGLILSGILAHQNVHDVRESFTCLGHGAQQLKQDIGGLLHRHRENALAQVISRRIHHLPFARFEF